jgi:hypothetical protein
VHEILVSSDYPRKVRIFCGLYVPRKGMPFRGIILGKSKLSTGFRGKACNRELFCAKGRLFHVEIHGKFLLFAHYPAERHDFPQDNSWEVKTSRISYFRKACLSAG